MDEISNTNVVNNINENFESIDEIKCMDEIY